MLSVTDVNEAPTITSNGGGDIAAVSVEENRTAVTTVTATDPDAGATQTYSIVGGVDSAKFTINSSTGVLTFASAPNFEAPTDLDANNVYNVIVRASDGTLSDDQALAVSVTNDTTAPTVTSIAAVSSKTGNDGTATFTVTFSEAVTGVDPTDFTLFGTAMDLAGGAPSISSVSGAGSIYTVTVKYNAKTNPAQGDGGKTLGLNLNPSNNVVDVEGLSAPATTFITAQISTLNPAGVSGEPINLALTDPSPDANDLVSVTVAGVPSGWTLNAGTNNGDGTWTIQTNDPSTLTITTPVDFAGAVVLPVTMSWTNADGSVGSAFVNNNVEAYAPGNPIFAVSADDHLTASSGTDLLVFAQPIARDVIHNFDVSADKIDLIGFAGVSGYANLSIADDANGNAVITTSPGSTITVLGVHSADLSAANFEFNVEPVTINTGTMTIADGAILPLGGVIENSGTIALGSSGSETDLQILVESVTLQGGGHVVLSDNDNNVIFGGAATATLINVDNTISGAGQLGAGQMTLVNAGTIVADGSHALVIDTGSNTVVNTGTLAATGSGVLIVDSAVGGHGSAAIGGHGAIEFRAASDANVGFAGDAAGTLSLDHAAGFSGTITGLNADDTLHFGDMRFSASAQLSYTANAAGTAGALVVSDGTQTAHISLIGHYAADAFQLSANAGGGTAVSNTAIDNGTVLGTSGADVLIGTAGNDILVGGQGSDTLTGGAGSDTFMFRSSDGRAVDTITDFDAAAGGDTLGIGALLQGYSDGADLAQFISLRQSGSDTVVSVDMDGSGSAHDLQDLLILQGVTGLDFATLIAHVDAHPLP